jgi:hypothetical protein
MHLFLLITHGAQAPSAALTLNRVALGAFFAISGYHKLFNASRHATLTRTLQDDGVHAVPIMQWLLPSVEFGGGCELRLHESRESIEAVAHVGRARGEPHLYSRRQRNHRCTKRSMTRESASASTRPRTTTI